MAFLNLQQGELAGPFHVDRVHPFLSHLRFELHFVILTNFINKTTLMNENVFFWVRGFNKTKPFGIIKKFYCSIFHNVDLILNDY